MNAIVLIAHNLRSCHNVGSLLRTAEGLGIQEVILTGYSPYPLRSDDSRLPHLARKAASAIHKTALDAEYSQPWRQEPDVRNIMNELRGDGYIIAALEQTAESRSLPDYSPPTKLALIVGREVEGIEPEVIANCDIALEIPMCGQKESFNVAQAAAMALYHCRFSGI